ncbi:MAG: rane-associated protein, partial [Actinomycetota bacterium]|nr:rane-associated protein [Actinomycetota bacterium]
AAVGTSSLEDQHHISTFGLNRLLVKVFADCGLLVGFFLPGDSLLFTAGLLVSQGKFHQPLALVCLLVAVAAVAGNQVGYEIGRRAGPAVFNKPDSRLFRRDYVDKTNAFFDRYGARAIIMARFVPIVRTFITVMAGAGRMDYRKYTVFSLIGGVLWGVGVTLLGYWLGGVQFVAGHIELILIAIVVVSVIPIVVELLRARRRTKST